MISLVLPYWQRQDAAADALRSLEKCYAGLDLEVIVVDDGSPQWFLAPDIDLRLRVLRLPLKAEPKNPCVPFNCGVAQARGDYIAISNSETLHGSSVLPSMLHEIMLRGRKCYVTAAARCEGRWHAHSSILPHEVEGVPMPAPFHFMAMLHRSLWDAASGFDEDYRDGAGYDDPDLLMRVQRAGASFVHRDDLVVEHARKGARADWTPEMHERNRNIFRNKWCSPSQR